MPGPETAVVRLAAPRRVWSVGDGWWIGAAAAAWSGAWFRPDWPIGLGLGVLLVLVATRWPVLLVVGALVLAGARASAATDVLASVDEGSSAGAAVVITDSEWVRSALRLDLVLDGVRWEAWARGGVARTLAAASVGHVYQVVVTTERADVQDRRYLWPRGAAGRAQVHEATRLGGGAVHHRAANSIRGLVVRSVEDLPQRDGVLVTGFVLGDDRDQLPEVVDDFRGSGLTHLLAVSGSNVATVLVMAGPLLRRLRPRWRLAVVCALLAEFAVVTRAEPSVLRACVLAALATGAATIGRRASPARLLSIAVVFLVLIDPLLVAAVGFQLSVAASAGIALLARPLTAIVRGPRVVAETLSVTLAAQLAVLPVQIATFGSLPLASIPANVLAAPAAAPAMVWGLHAGLVGGFVGPPAAAWLHLPTRLAVGWVASIARISTGLDLPMIEAPEVGWVCAVLSVAASVAWLTGLRWSVATIAVLAVFAVCNRVTAPVPAGAHLEVVSLDPAIVVVDRPEPAWALAQLRQAGMRRVDVLVLRSASRAGEGAARAITARLSVGEIWAPRALPSIGAGRVTDEMDLGPLAIGPAGSRLRVTRSG